MKQHSVELLTGISNQDMFDMALSTSPVGMGGGATRGVGRIVEMLTGRFGNEVAIIEKTSSGAIQREWINARSGMKHVLRGPEVDQIRPGGPKLKHWNYEQQIPVGEGRWKKINNVHLDENGNPIK